MKFEISDNRSIRKVRFTSKEAEYFTVEICGDISGSIRVYSYCPHGDTIHSVFKKLGSMLEPWDGELNWVSLEGEFSLKFSCDSLGHVFLSVEIDNDNEEFTINCVLNVDLGQLKEISKNANNFFKEIT